VEHCINRIVTFGNGMTRSISNLFSYN